MIRLAPSILAAGFSKLGAEIAAATRRRRRPGARRRDGRPLRSEHHDWRAGREVVAQATTLPLDVHLMITDPDRYLEAFIDAGANLVSVHVEVLPHLHRTITQIKKLGAKAGVVLNPSTPVSAISEIAADVDFVLVMSVNPGFGGQAFIPASLDKIRRLAGRRFDRAGNRAPIEVGRRRRSHHRRKASSRPAPNGWSPATRSSAAATPRRRRRPSRTPPSRPRRDECVAGAGALR
jgi:ribulose-phosphate 3-epimerase